MPPLESHVKDTIMNEYPGVWDVSFCMDGDVIVVVSATPQTSLCLISLSRLIAAHYIPSYYTIDVRFGWKPCRFQVLFGSRDQ